MKLVFIDGRTWFSALVKWLSHDNFFASAPTSHFQFVFETNGQGVAFESNLLGTRLKFWANTLKRIKVIESFELSLSLEQEDALWGVLVQKFDGKSYDFGGALYLGYRRFLFKAFKIPVPKRNRFGKADAFFCNEIINALQLVKDLKEIDFDASMQTPEQMRGTLREWFNEGR